MPAIFDTIEVLNPWRYVPEFNEDGTEKHITQDGARYHVISYHGTKDGVALVCSCEKCEVNKNAQP